MKNLAQQMKIYGAYHRHPLNRLSHFIGVPLIVFGLLVLLDRVAFEADGFRLSAALLAVLVLLAYYVALDRALGLASAAVLLPLTFAAGRVGHDDPARALSVFLGCFVAGWVFQLLGHWVEGRRPALVDNLFQVFVAPIFLVAEAAFALGLKRRLRRRVRGDS